jgi:GNAT superfamily N-acetyltransferase
MLWLLRAGRRKEVDQDNVPRPKGVAAVDVTYQLEPDLSPDEFIDVLVRSTLAQRRPVHDINTTLAMLKNAGVIVTARLDGLVVGVARAITDFAFCTYLSDLAVDERHQRKGIGRELIRRTHEAAGLHTTLILLAAPKAQTYYPHVGMAKHESCWVIAGKPRDE